VDLQDNSFNKEFTRDRQRKLDWDEYLDFLTEHRFNYLRNWVIWSTGSGSMAPVNRAIASPMPYPRVDGKGKARDGQGPRKVAEREGVAASSGVCGAWRWVCDYVLWGTHPPTVGKIPFRIDMSLRGAQRRSNLEPCGGDCFAALAMT
jgi:hypothetical protein